MGNYHTMPAAGGSETLLCFGKQTRARFVDADEAAFAADAMNEALDKSYVPVGLAMDEEVALAEVEAM